MIGVLVFLFGLVIGSFLNVVVYRHGSGMRLNGRSKCLSCGKTLTARMLVPLFSFMLMRGRCVYCSAKLSFQYPLIEAVAGVLFVVIAHKNGLFLPDVSSHALIIFLMEAAAWSTLLVVTVYDLKHNIIPDRFSFIFALLAGVLLSLRSHWGLLTLPYIPFLDGVPPWIDFAAGPLLAAPFALLWFLSGGRAMGFGDAKLAWGIGWFLGFSGGGSALILSFWIAFFPSIALLFIRGKHFTMKSEIPFAPFLVLGTLVVYVFGVSILSWAF